MKQFKLETLFTFLKEHNYTLGTVESASCGKLANTIGSVPGVSSFYWGGLIVYHADLKRSVLGIDPKLIDKYGTVSKEIGEQMALKGHQVLQTDLVIAITGNAGPDPIEDKPNGMYFVSLYINQEITTYQIYLDSQLSRIDQQLEISYTALKLLYEKLI